MKQKKISLFGTGTVKWAFLAAAGLLVACTEIPDWLYTDEYDPNGSPTITPPGTPPDNPNPPVTPPTVAFTGCDGKAGETVEIGNQTWMKKNLDCKVVGGATGNAADTGKCYGNSLDSCTKYGRLYNWATAMNLSASYNNSSASGQIKTPHQGICPTITAQIV